MNTKLVEKPNATQLIKVKTLRPIIVNGQEIAAGAAVELSEEDFKEFSKPIRGSYDFEGLRSDKTAVVSEIKRVIPA